MLKYLMLRNFRAFQNQRLDLSRINVFVGPNNSGKSSILSAINLLAQTAIANAANIPLVLRGPYDDLGTFHDIVHGNNPNSLLGLEFGIGEFSYHIEYKYRSQRREIEISKYLISDDQGQIFEYALRRKEAYQIRYGGRLFDDFFPEQNKRRPFFWGLSVYDPNLNLRRYPAKSADFSEETVNFVSQIDSRLNRAAIEVNHVFRGFDSLSPFREPPIRTYLFSGAAPASVGRTGSNAVDMLVTDNFRRGKEKAGFIDNVSKWLLATEMAKGIKVRALTSRHYEICVIGHDGTDHNLCDVGFGCSQVLPVLIGALSIRHRAAGTGPGRNPIFMVEEPEIHLHPNAQAELGTFFAHLFQKVGQVIIETHSSNLIIRLQRHVAAGDLKADDVRVFFVSGGSVPPQVTVLDLDEGGFFKQQWPGGFFPQRQEESLALAKAVAEHGKSGSS